eukprot:gene4782-6851_t
MAMLLPLVVWLVVQEQNGLVAAVHVYVWLVVVTASATIHPSKQDCTKVTNALSASRANGFTPSKDETPQTPKIDGSEFSDDADGILGSDTNHSKKLCKQLSQQSNQTCQEYTMERPVKTNTEDDPNTSQKFVLHASQQQSGKLNSHNLTNGSDTQHDSRKDNHQHLLLAEAYSSSDTSKPSTQNESKTTEVHANLKEKNSGTKDNTSSQQSSNIVSNVSQPSTKMEDKQQSNRGCYRQLFHSSNSPISSTEELYNKSQTQTKEKKSVAQKRPKMKPTALSKSTHSPAAKKNTAPPPKTEAKVASQTRNSGSETKKESAQIIDREMVREFSSQLFHHLKIGMKVRICQTLKMGSADITTKYPELLNQRGTIFEVPQYPCTWLSVLIDGTDKVIKVRSSNIRLEEPGMGEFVQTERLSRSIFFHRLTYGMEIYVLDRPRKEYRPGTDFQSIGKAAVIEKVPNYPRILGTDDLVKVRTSQIALTKDAPAPSGADLVDALEKARIKAAQASQSSRKCSETTRRRRRRKSKKNSATDNAEAGSKQVQQKTPTKPHPQNSVPHGQPLSCFDPSYSPIIESHMPILNPQMMMSCPTYNFSRQLQPVPHLYQTSVSTLIQPPWQISSNELVYQQQMSTSSHHRHTIPHDSAALVFCRDLIMPTLLQHRLSWPFIDPIAPEHLDRFETARQLQFAFSQNALVSFNQLHSRIQSGAYPNAATFVQDIRELFRSCYVNFGYDQSFLELVVELEIVLDHCLNCAPQYVISQLHPLKLQHSTSTELYEVPSLENGNYTANNFANSKEYTSLNARRNMNSNLQEPQQEPDHFVPPPPLPPPPRPPVPNNMTHPNPPSITFIPPPPRPPIVVTSHVSDGHI